MLHEPASAPSDNPTPIIEPPKVELDPALEKQETALDLVSDVMVIENRLFPQWDELSLEDRATMIQGDVDYMLTVDGYLKDDSESAYDVLDKQLEKQDMMALFREVYTPDGKVKHRLHILEGRMKTPSQPSPIPNIVLLILTIASTLYIGTATAIGEIRLTDVILADTLSQNVLTELWRGLPYTISIMLILGSHEMAHWFMMRKYKVVASLPYFIPSFLFSPFGTFGAVIVTKGAIKNRKALFDIGVAGPLAGLIFAIPILLIGLATSPVIEIIGGAVEGNSIVYALSKILVFGQFLPNATSDVMVNQLAWAGWTGLFVTALNLIPLGQLDGGHILYATFGSRARKLYYPILGVALFLTIFVSSIWVILLLMLMLLGKVYAVPLNDITRLDPLRRRIATLTLIIFALIFIPAPIMTPDNSGGMIASVFIAVSWYVLRSRFANRLR